MAIKTTLEELEEVQAAITKVRHAQSGGRGDKTLQRANLAELWKEQEILLARYKAEQGTGGIPAINIGILGRS